MPYILLRNCVSDVSLHSPSLHTYIKIFLNVSLHSSLLHIHIKLVLNVTLYSPSLHIYMALLWRYRALLRRYTALLRGCRALLRKLVLNVPLYSPSLHIYIKLCLVCPFVHVNHKCVSLTVTGEQTFPPQKKRPKKSFYVLDVPLCVSLTFVSH